MGVARVPQQMLKLTVHFSQRDDGGLRAWSDDLPGFVLSHADAQAVIEDVEPALAAMLSAKLGCKVKVFSLSSPAEFNQAPVPPIPAYMIPQREYASQIC